MHNDFITQVDPPKAGIGNGGGFAVTTMSTATGTDYVTQTVYMPTNGATSGTITYMPIPVQFNFASTSK